MKWLFQANFFENLRKIASIQTENNMKYHNVFVQYESKSNTHPTFDQFTA